MGVNKIMNHDPYKALYIHIPFCKQRCFYCDFCTDAVKSDSMRVRRYVDKLISEIRDWSSKGELENIETIYIGGGTPTHLGHKKLVELIYLISTTIDLRCVSEFTIEANPESLSEEIVKDIYALGVNRISIGIQSFNDKHLRYLGRIHDSNQAKNAISIALKRFDNVSIDLMCGLPYQSLEEWDSDLEIVRTSNIAHVSIYPLTAEEKTPYYKQCMKGKAPWPDSDVQATMMERAQYLLGEAGFKRYEVASYSKAGFESRHNSAYWTGIPYLGIGRSATTMTQNSERRMRVQDKCVIDDLNHEQMVAEDIMLGFRMSKGVSEDQIYKASKTLPKLEDCIAHLIERSLIEKCDDRYCPTHLGWLNGNELYGEIFDLA